MSIKAIIFSTLGVILGLLALTWVIQGNEFFLLTVFGSKMENARYNAQKESQPYRDGLVKEMRRLQTEYVQADPSHQNALAGVILGTVGAGDEEKLPIDLQQFLDQLRQQQVRIPAK
jgi:hypothetical protein